MKQLNLTLGKLLMCTSELLVGVLLLINPVGFTTGIITALGILLLFMGIFSVFHYFQTEPEDAQKEQSLVKGLCAMLSGLFCIIKSNWFIVTFPILTIVYGVIILFTGIMRVQWAVDMLRMKREKWYIAAIGAALSVIFALIIFSNPFTTTAFLWTFVAISLIVEAVADLVILIFMKIGEQPHKEQYPQNGDQ